MMESKRFDYVDICAAIMLLYMINVHLSDYNWCTKATFTFMDYLMIPFMPFFFYKAGMFHRIKPQGQLLKDTLRRLIVPFIVFSIIGEIIHSCRLCVEFNDYSLYSHIIIPLGTLILKGSIHGNLALWFLLTLFVVKNLYNIIVTLPNPRYVLTIGVVLILAIGFSYLNKYIYPLFVPYLVANTCSGLFFYAVGHQSQQVKISNRKVIPICLFIICFISICCPSGANMRSNDISGSYLTWVVYSASFVFTMLFVLKKASIRNKIICGIGRNSMGWYVLHWPLILLSRLIFLSGCGMQEGWTLRLIQSFFIILVTPFLIIPIKRYCPAIIGEKQRN